MLSLRGRSGRRNGDVGPNQETTAGSLNRNTMRWGCSRLANVDVAARWDDGSTDQKGHVSIGTSKACRSRNRWLLSAIWLGGELKCAVVALARSGKFSHS